MNRIGWPIVALVGIGIGGFLGIFALIPDDEPTGRSSLLALITVTVGAVTTWVTTRSAKELKSDVAEVKKIVNGNTQRLIAKLPDPIPGDVVQVIRVSSDEE